MKYLVNLLLLSIFTLLQVSCGPNGEPAVAVAPAAAQIKNPVKWVFETKKVSDTEVELIFSADIEKGWHMYSIEQPTEDGGRPLEITFEPNSNYKLSGKIIEPKPHEEFDQAFEVNVRTFEGKVTFKQKVELLSKASFSIKGNVSGQACIDQCVLLDEAFEFKIEGTGGQSATDTNDTTHSQTADTAKPAQATGAENPYLWKSVDLNNPAGPCGEKREDLSLWAIFLLGILGGSIALVTPYVFPMIPLTVSFFTKSGPGAKGMRDSMLYGFFIMLIYFLLSLPFHLLPGIDPEILNQISTNTWLNIAFFLIFVVFAASFFGYFEITLPNKWANKTDTASNFGGLAGIFFMAVTLAIVSFSCTGPILGTLLAGTLNADSAGTIDFLGMSLQVVAAKLTVGMLGFGLALGLPFALFAAFPAWLNSLPKSGGWLNSVKVVLGFVEVALAVKFLSNADLVEQWGFLKRETFFALWFICGAGLTLYIFGVIRFPHDSPVKKYAISRIGLGLIVLAFTVYLVPGIIGQKWWSYNLLSGFPPPKYYSYFEQEHDMKVFQDFNEGLAQARKENKPMLLDFTGWACVNCRKMEENVWTNDEVKDILTKKYVVVSLYVDERTQLAPEKQHTIEVPDGRGGKKQKKIKTIGDQWGTLQTLSFASNSQPWYVMLDSRDTVLLGNPVGYTPDANEYAEYLNCGLETFGKLQKQP